MGGPSSTVVVLESSCPPPGSGYPAAPGVLLVPGFLVSSSSLFLWPRGSAMDESFVRVVNNSVVICNRTFCASQHTESRPSVPRRPAIHPRRQHPNGHWVVLPVPCREASPAFSIQFGGIARITTLVRSNDQRTTDRAPFSALC